MAKNLLFIVNPRAGRSKSFGPLLEAAGVFSEAGYLLSVRVTHARGDAERFAREYGGAFDLVACHGGDGTLNETVNGLLALDGAARPPVCYLPGGSTNDFAASLNISSDPAAAARAALRSQPRPLDAGLFHDGRGERRFVYVASFGAFTRASYAAPQDSKNVFGHFAYLLESVRDLDTLHPYRMKLTADGEVFDGEYLFGAVGNTTSIAGVMKLSSERIAFDDGLFELLLVPVPKTPAETQAIVRAFVNQDYDHSDVLIFRQVRQVTAETDEDIPWTLDGEYAPGGSGVRIEVLRRAVSILH